MEDPWRRPNQTNKYIECRGHEPCPIGSKALPHSPRVQVRPSTLLSPGHALLLLTFLTQLSRPCLTITPVPLQPRRAPTTTATSRLSERRRTPTLRPLSAPDAPTTSPLSKPQVTTDTYLDLRLLVLNDTFNPSHQPREGCRQPASVMSRLQERCRCPASRKCPSPKRSPRPGKILASSLAS